MTWAAECDWTWGIYTNKIVMFMAKKHEHHDDPLILLGFYIQSFSDTAKCLSQDLRSSGCGCPFLKHLAGWVAGFQDQQLPAGVSGITQFFKHHSHLYGGCQTLPNICWRCWTSPVYYSSKLYIFVAKKWRFKNKRTPRFPHKVLVELYYTTFFWVLFHPDIENL